MTSLRHQSGQAAVLTVLFMVVLIGMTSAVLDVGAWFRADRKLQANTDAAALAGAHALPEDTGQALALAVQYGDKNGGDIEAGDVSFETTVVANDTIVVDSDAAAPGIFAQIFGIDSVTVAAHAKARTGVMSSARYVAPVVVNEKHPMLACTPPPCSDPTEIQLMDLHKPGSGNAAGSFGLLNLASQSTTGSVGSEEVGSWMLDGFDEYMDVGVYRAVPSTEFNSSHFQNALKLRFGDEVLFPIYREPILGGGQNAKFDVVGWIGFVPTGSKIQGDKGKIFGSFTKVIWEGIVTEDPNQLDFGARAIELLE